MGKIKKVFKLFFDKEFRRDFFISIGFYNHMRDDKYLKMVFKRRMGKELNLISPKTFNEKMQWLKLYDRQPIYTTMADKYTVKKYVASIIGDQYLIPTIGVWEKASDIDFDALPNQFVLKCTNDSGGLIICKDKSMLDIKQAKKQLSASLKKNYFYNQREWPYKDVKRLIICEPYMKDEKTENLIVYKFFTFSGEPYLIQVIQNDKHEDESIDYFDTNWNLLDLRQNFPNSVNHLPKPKNLELMLELVKKLSGPSFLRVDLYEINGKVYFSEFTFYSDAGMASFEPEDWDLKLGDLIKLPCK